MCQSPVPQLVTSTFAASPAPSTSSERITLAIGERQMLPRQTNAIRYGEPVGAGRLTKLSPACSSGVARRTTSLVHVPM